MHHPSIITQKSGQSSISSRSKSFGHYSSDLPQEDDLGKEYRAQDDNFYQKELSIAKELNKLLFLHCKRQEQTIRNMLEQINDLTAEIHQLEEKLKLLQTQPPNQPKSNYHYLLKQPSTHKKERVSKSYPQHTDKNKEQQLLATIEQLSSQNRKLWKDNETATKLYAEKLKENEQLIKMLKQPYQPKIDQLEQSRTVISPIQDLKISQIETVNHETIHKLPNLINILRQVISRLNEFTSENKYKIDQQRPELKELNQQTHLTPYQSLEQKTIEVIQKVSLLMQQSQIQRPQTQTEIKTDNNQFQSGKGEKQELNQPQSNPVGMR